MDLDDAGSPSQNREKTAPFLLRTFVKIGGFHRLTLFEDGTLPTTDEQQLFTWKDATLREVLTTLRNTAPHVAEYRHPLARFSFRTVYADPSNKGRFAAKDIGMVYSRDILGEPGAVNATAPRLLLDTEPASRAAAAVGGDGDARAAPESAGARDERTLDELRVVPGDYLCVSVLLPKNVTLPTEISIKGSGAAPGAWKSPLSAGPHGRGEGGWGRGAAPSAPGLGRGGGGGGGHWRGESNAPAPRGGRGRGDSGRDRDRDRDRDLDRDSRVPPPRRHDSPPPRGGGWGARGGRNRRSPSRSRSPPRRRRYD